MANILEALNYSGGSATSNWDRLQFILKRNADTFDASLHAALTWDQESIFNWDSVKCILNRYFGYTLQLYNKWKMLEMFFGEELYRMRVDQMITVDLDSLTLAIMVQQDNFDLDSYLAATKPRFESAVAQAYWPITQGSDEDRDDAFDILDASIGCCFHPLLLHPELYVKTVDNSCYQQDAQINTNRKRRRVESESEYVE